MHLVTGCNVFLQHLRNALSLFTVREIMNREDLGLQKLLLLLVTVHCLISVLYEVSLCQNLCLNIGDIHQYRPN